ncbi:MAG: hypothetical protein JJT76_19185 [Clostridiaceae bacterium]|nr:hypothetical protein [Clostridiaceae bacterium]
MVVAPKRDHYIQPQEQQQQQQRVSKNIKRKKSYRFEKIASGLGVSIVLILSLALLIRFAAITDARHHVHSLNQQIEQLESQRENLRVEVERSSKSQWIENEAKERLNMQYPQSQQMIYINVDPIEVAMISSRIKEANERNNNIEEGSSTILDRAFNKFVGFLKI